MSRAALLTSCLTILFLFFSSCDDVAHPKVVEDYKFFNLEQGGWKSKRIVQELEKLSYTATEVPLQYYILRHEDPSQVDSIFEENKKERIIEFEFANLQKSDVLDQSVFGNAYEESVKYMASTIQSDFYVVTSANDTVHCSGVHFERNFNVAPYKRLLLYFNGIDPEQSIKLIYNDRLFNNGTIKFNFKETPLLL